MSGYRYPDFADFVGWTRTHKSLIAQARLFESHVAAALLVGASSQALVSVSDRRTFLPIISLIQRTAEESWACISQSF